MAAEIARLLPALAGLSVDQQESVLAPAFERELQKAKAAALGMSKRMDGGFSLYGSGAIHSRRMILVNAFIFKIILNLSI